jgi:hypothetical protein
MDLHTIKFGLGIAFCLIIGIAALFYLYVKVMASSNR